MNINTLRRYAGLPSIPETLKENVGQTTQFAATLLGIESNTDSEKGPFRIVQFKYGPDSISATLYDDPAIPAMMTGQMDIDPIDPKSERGVKLLAIVKACIADSEKQNESVAEQNCAEATLLKAIAHSLKNPVNVGKAAVALARAGFTVSLDFSNEEFYFNFKSTESADEALRIIDKSIDRTKEPSSK